MGTTGEANSFSVDERKEALEQLINDGFPPEKLMVGTGLCAIPETVELTRHACNLEVGGILILPPFYYKNVSDDGLFAAFEWIIDQCKDVGPEIYLYHFPKMSATPFSHELISRLVSSFPDQAVGIKDSSGDWDNMRTMCERFPGFRVFAGSERFLTDILNVGGQGCISASTNLSAQLASEVHKLHGTTEGAALQQQLNAVRKVIEGYPMIPALKHRMATSTGDSGWQNMRPPQVRLSKTEGERLDSEMEETLAR